jgi:hypothetical protein
MQMEPIPRRRLLQWGAFGALALGTATTFMYARKDSPGEDLGDYGQLLVLSNSNALTLLAMIQIVLPESRWSDTDLHRQVISRIDEEFYFVDSKIQDDLRLALNVLEYLPVLFGDFSRFSKLGRAQRQAFLSAMQTTRSDTFRAVLHNCRLVPLYTYYGLESSWESIGYDGSFSRLTPLVSEQREYYAKTAGKRSL